MADDDLPPCTCTQYISVNTYRTRKPCPLHGMAFLLPSPALEREIAMEQEKARSATANPTTA